MNRARFLLASLALLLATSVSAQTSVTGDWDVYIASPQGTNTVKVTLTQDGEKVKGVFKTQMGELPFEGTISGDDLKFSYTLPFQGQIIDITMNGKVDGDAMTGTANFGGLAEGQWTAKRAEAATAPAAAPPASNGASPDPAASAGGAAGEWDVTFKTPQGDFPASAKLTDDAGKLSGTFSSQMGEVPVSGTFDGNAIKLTLTAQTPQGSMNVTLTGALQGDQIVNGQAEIQGMGMMEFSARRKQ